MRLGEARLADFKRARERGAKGFKFSVAKNRLLKLALQGTPGEGLVDHLTGPTAVTFCSQDAFAPAQAMKEFSKQLNVKESEEVTDLKKEGDKFKVTTSKGSYDAKFVLIAIGVQGSVRKVEIECDDAKNVLYRVLDPTALQGKNVLVVGGGDTAIEHAVLLKEAGAKVTLSYRKPEFFRLKDVNEKAIRESGIPLVFNSNVKSIKSGKAVLDVNGQTQEVPTDCAAVFAGTIPATDFLTKIGLKLENNKPGYTTSFESVDIPGLYIAGDLTKQPLIKPAINHGVLIINEITAKLSK
jgi:thioredoxin reductase